MSHEKVLPNEWDKNRAFWRMGTQSYSWMGHAKCWPLIMGYYPRFVGDQITSYTDEAMMCRR
jgi:hypothetical protein